LLLYNVLLLASAAERSEELNWLQVAKTLHPPRPSGRSPHRPLIFLWQRFPGG